MMMLFFYIIFCGMDLSESSSMEFTQPQILLHYVVLIGQFVGVEFQVEGPAVFASTE